MKKFILITALLLLIGGSSYYVFANMQIKQDTVYQDGSDYTVISSEEEQDEQAVPKEENTKSFEESSRREEIIYSENKPVGYTDPRYSNIVGYDKTIGITMSIPAGVVPSLIDDGSLDEVVAYRLEDGLGGSYNDAIAIFSCFKEGLPNLEKNIPYVDFSEEKELEIFKFNDTEYFLIKYENFFVLTSPVYSVEFKNDVLSGCGLVLAGKEFSEIHLSFIDGIKFIESRDVYLHNIYSQFHKMYSN